MDPFTKPKVSKKVLIGIAGAIWCGVGIMMCVSASIWLSRLHAPSAIGLGLMGIALSVFISRYLFSMLAQRNISRLKTLPDLNSVFHFQTSKSYVLVGFMIGLGVFLRHSTLPKATLSVIYLAIGGSLVSASFKYYRSLK